jgi:mRNA interferase RelE/StbE
MQYRILFSDHSKKDLKGLDEGTTRRILNVLYQRVRTNPLHYSKPLTNTKLRKVRVGGYRVLIEIVNKEIRVLVIKIGLRKNIYDWLKKNKKKSS